MMNVDYAEIRYKLWIWWWWIVTM